MTDVSRVARQRFLNEKIFYFFQTHIFYLGRACALPFQAKIAGKDLIARAHQDGAFYGVVEFAHITRPRMLHHSLQRCWFETLDRLPVALGVQLEEMRSQQRNVFASFSQRWNVQLNCIEPEKKVGAEAAFRALQFQISVRGGEHANINLARLRRANALHLAGLQHAQQFGLLLHRNVGDFIEKQRAVIGEFKTSNAVGAGVSESAFDMAEQLALERAFRKTTGIYSDHRTARARREHMQGLSDNFFSRAMLARDQYVRVARANAAQQHQQRLHGLGFRNEHRPVLRAQKTILGFQTLGPPHSAVKINLRADNAEQALIVPRLLNEVPGA